MMKLTSVILGNTDLDLKLRGPFRDISM